MPDNQEVPGSGAIAPPRPGAVSRAASAVLQGGVGSDGGRNRRGRRAALVLAALLAAAACGVEGGGGAAADRLPGGVDTVGLRMLEVPAEHRDGRSAFDAVCAACHGEAALGTALGPPLVHIVYEPGHHSDAAFVLAVARGVRAHHWRFGDMPPQPGLPDDEVQRIIAYVRWLQREAGVY